MPNTVPCGEFTVYYHEGFTGRSQGLEMMLVASKAKWKRAPWSEVKDPTCFAAPALGHDQTGKMISQTTAAAQWLGTEVGFRPPTGLRAEALKIALDIADVWSEAYKTRKDANSWEEVEAFLSGRLAQFFGVLEACAKKYGKDGVLVGAKTSYCDFLLVNAIATCEFLFGETRMATVLAACPLLAAVNTKVLAMPGVADCKNSTPVLYANVAAAGKMPFKD